MGALGGSGRPRALLALVLAGLCALALAAVVVRAGDRHAGTHRPGAPGPAAVHRRPALPVGLNTGSSLLHLDRRALDEAVGEIATTGFTWIRVDFSWTEIQPASPDTWVWGPTDRVVDAARAHGLHVLGLLTYTPPWARTTGCASFTCPPARAGLFGRFAQEVGDRYVPRGVHTFQVWNEPNLDIFWKSPDPAAYGAVVRCAGAALRAGHDGNVKVVFGSLAQPAGSAAGVDPAVFVRAACADGCRVDAVGVDPYTFPELPSASRRHSAWSDLTRDGALRRAVDRSVGPRTPLWVTQFGAPVATGAVLPPYVDERRQAAIVLAGLRLARRDPLVGGFFVNSWRDVAGSSDYRDRFGLWRADGTRRPVVDALHRALRVRHARHGGARARQR